MSVSKYRYTPSCDGQPCPGDCDLCGKEDDMDDLISRSAAIDAATFSAAEWDGAFVQDLNVRIREAIKGVLSAQPDLSGYSDKLWKAEYERRKREGQADIVRCKDCKQYDSHGHRCKHWNHGVNPTDWCSYAERRTNG